jgi:hypothetical protein
VAELACLWWPGISGRTRRQLMFVFTVINEASSRCACGIRRGFDLRPALLSRLPQIIGGLHAQPAFGTGREPVGKAQREICAHRCSSVHDARQSDTRNAQILSCSRHGQAEFRQYVLFENFAGMRRVMHLAHLHILSGSPDSRQEGHPVLRTRTLGASCRSPTLTNAQTGPVPVSAAASRERPCPSALRTYRVWQVDGAISQHERVGCRPCYPFGRKPPDPCGGMFESR